MSRRKWTGINGAMSSRISVGVHLASSILRHIRAKEGGCERSINPSIWDAARLSA